MKKVPNIEQMNQTECGLCCCLSILQYYGSREKLLDLRNTVECGRDGYSFSKLKLILESRAMEAKTYRAKDINILKNISLPCIVFWDNEHFVVVYRVTEKKIYIMNPARGYENYSIEEADKHFSKAIMIVYPKDDFKPLKSNIRSPWIRILKIIGQSKCNIFLAVLFAVTSYCIIIEVPNFTTDIIDSSINSVKFNKISESVKIIIALAFLYLLSVFIRNANILRTNIAFCNKIEKDTFLQLLKLPYKFFELRTSGDILYRMSSLSGFRELFSTQVINGIVDLGTICFIGIFMIKKSIILSLVVLILSLINFLFLLITREPIARAINNEVLEQSEMNSVENECLITISAIKTSGIEDEMYRNWENSLKKLIRRYKERYMINNIYNSITGTFQVFAPVVILVVGIYQYSKGIMTIGQVVAFQSLASILFAAEVAIFSSYTQLVLSTAYLNRVNDIWCEKEEEGYLRTRELDMKGKVELKNLSFSYARNSQKVLYNVNIKINTGQKIAFVGKSGSGKSSIGKVIAGLYQVEDGMVFFDDLDMNQIKKSSISRNIGVVPQDVYLLNRSIKNNITMNDKSITDKEIEIACKAANIYDEIIAMPMGFHTIVSEMGMNLSGGQRQRIALAKALINKPKIVILDEATSALDAINEKNITEYLKANGCTQIIIAHRLSTIIDADAIYVLKDGRIVEQGTHSELMNQKGEYYELYITNGSVEKSV